MNMYIMGKIHIPQMHTQVCQHFQTVAGGGGQNRRVYKNQGRPSGCTPTRVLEHISSVSPTPLFPRDTIPTYVLSACGLDASDLRCPICMEVYQCPVELQCRTLVCATCCSRWVQVTAGVSCPCCFTHQLDDANIKPPPSAFTDLLGSLWVECTSEGCAKLVKARNLTKHLESGCRQHIETATDSPSRVSLRDVLSQPMTTPTTPAEKRVFRSLFRREEATNPCSTVTVETAGQVCTLILLDLQNHLHPISVCSHFTLCESLDAGYPHLMLLGRPSTEGLSS